jgi:hypothetical protein
MINPVIAAALLIVQTAPAPPPCLTREEVGDMAIMLAPRLFGAVADRCRAQVGPGAFLNTGWAAYRLRLETEAGPRRESAMRAFDKMSGGEALPAEQRGTAMELMSAMMTAAVGAALPLDTCADVDRMLGALAPLPVANLGVLIGSGFALARVGQAQPPSDAVPAEDGSGDHPAPGQDDDGEEAAAPPPTPTICPA